MTKVGEEGKDTVEEIIATLPNVTSTFTEIVLYVWMCIQIIWSNMSAKMCYLLF